MVEPAGDRPAGDAPQSAPLPASPAIRTPVPVREVDLDWRSVAVVLGAFVALVSITALVRAAPRSITALAIGTLLALALNPLVTRLQRRVGGRRTVAVGIVLGGFVLVVAGVLALLAPPAISEGRKLDDQLPRVVRQLGDLPLVGEQLRDADAPEKVEKWVRELPDRLEGDTTPIRTAGRAVFGGLLAGFITILVAITLLLDGERLVRGVRRLVPPVRKEQADRLADLAYRVIGKYVAGSLLVATIAGLSILVVGLILRVPLTPLLAVWVAMFDLVPQIGGAAGGIPFVALGFSKSATTGVICAVFFMLYLQFENNILSPLVVGNAVKLSPPATMTAALVGVSAAGVVGALVAVPLVGAAKAVYLELRPPVLPPAPVPSAAAELPPEPPDSS